MTNLENRCLYRTFDSMNHDSRHTEDIAPALAAERMSGLPSKEYTDLTGLQEKFCHEYLIDLDVREAMRRAGYSDTTAARDVYEHPGVQARIKELMEERRLRIGIDQDFVLRELVYFANSDIGTVLEWGDGEEGADGKAGKPYVKLVPREKLSRNQRKIISSIKQTREGFSVTIVDRLKSLELIGKHLGMFQENVNHQHSFVDFLAAAQQTAEEQAAKVAHLKQLSGEISNGTHQDSTGDPEPASDGESRG